MEFSKDLRDAVASGDVTVSFRLWRRPKVRPGGRYRVGPAWIEVDSVELMPFAAITPGDTRRCGERDRESLRQRAAHAGRSLTTHCFTGWNFTWPGLRHAEGHQMRC